MSFGHAMFDFEVRMIKVINNKGHIVRNIDINILVGFALLNVRNPDHFRFI